LLVVPLLVALMAMHHRLPGTRTPASDTRKGFPVQQVQ